MNVDLLVTGITHLATATGPCAKRGAAMRELLVIREAALAIAGGCIAWVGRARDWSGYAQATLDLGGRAVVPALVDPHTHAVWAGDRLNDFEARTSGMSYEEMLKAGGGIRSSIRATAAASVEELVQLAAPRVAALLHSGAGTIEIKSGYGFEPDAELRMLRAVQHLRRLTRARLLATLLIHLPPVAAEERAKYVTTVCSELIPEAARQGLATALDVFVEVEAWHPEEARVLCACARKHGLAIKLHTEQFACIGGLELGLDLGALSVDHLEASVPRQFAALAASPTIVTVLPGVSLHLGLPPAPARQMIDAGCAIAVGTDLNPGSSPLFSAAAALALAVRVNRLTAVEALVAGTVNAACALSLEDAGRLERGMPADFLVLEGADWRELVYTLGANPVREVWIAGTKVAEERVATR